MLYSVFERKRTFQFLNDARRNPVIWTSAPAGAGKTTLIASYIESHNLNCVWYQIDPRDSDPATFFHYLRLAVNRASPRKRIPIPSFNPQFMPGIDAFSLRFFEAVYQRLPKPIVIVMDNYQQIKPKSITHKIVNKGLSILPEGITGIVISRERPPAVFSRILANRKMFQIGWDAVKLTLEESAGIAHLQTGNSISKTIIQKLHQATGGWAVGLLLMLAQADPEDLDWQWIQGFTPQEILDYFAKEVFEREPPEIQDFMLRSAFLPYMTNVMAKNLTGNANAGKILAKLHRENRFTERRLRKRLYYQFHPLYRGFLISQAKRRLSDTKLNGSRLKAAKVLTEEGDADAAAELLHDAQAWGALTELIMKHALTMIQQGRNQSLFQWLETLPKSVVAEKPWLEAWMGIARLPFDPKGSLSFLEKAFGTFRKHDDTFGLFLCWPFIIRAIFLRMADFSSFDLWIQVLEKIVNKYRQFPSRDIEGQVVSGMLIALVHRKMDYPHIESWVDRALVLISSSLDLSTKVSITNNVVHYFLLTGNYGRAAQIIDLLRPSSWDDLPDSKEAIAVVAHATISSFYYCYVGMHAKCIDVVYKGLAIAKKTGFIILNNIMVGHGIQSALIHEEYEAARTLFEDNAISLKNAMPLDQGLIDYVKSLETLQSGNLNQTKAYATSALKASIDVGSQFSTIFCHLLNARVLHDTGEQKAAQDHLDKALHLSQLTGTKHLIFHALMFKARFALEQEHLDACRRLLREALALGKEIGLYHNMIDSRSNVARLCAVALEHGIETNYVSTYIRKRCLTLDPPPIALENWPWQLKIFTLGGFSILRDDNPIRYATKAQKKPLELIKVLIALGGRNVGRAQICDSLWPDAEGDKADRALTTTLHRLRRYLDNDQVVQVQNGKLGLNPSYCWVDCWAFESLLSMAENAFKSQALDTQISLIEKALAHYNGMFLAGDTLQTWAVSPSERFRNKYLQAVYFIGNHLESMDQWEQASYGYLRSLEIDDLSEVTYQRLMRCLQKLGRHADALSIYERCRTTLDAAFGLPPSAKTEQIRHSLWHRR
ncbi:MAG: BTAD domain-containing putative transcriptional regulator [Thermodesulfobacteriota bacterium]